MSSIIYDDIGSYPLPEGVSRDWVQVQFENDPDNEKLKSVVSDVFRQKIDAGVEVPTYPQLRDMNNQFLSIIKDPECCDEPFRVREEAAVIAELEMIEQAASLYYQQTGERPDIRICVTGPVELYLQEFGSSEYTDILNQMAESVNLFVKNAVRSAKNFRVRTVSIDEPSIGINSQIMFENPPIIDALTASGDYASRNNIDVEIHLHSPLHYELACQSESINVIGIESAANPSYFELIDKNILEKWDSFLRVGIARTDISNLGAILNEKHSINVWKNPSMLQEIVTGMETPSVIAKRLERAYSLFDERIKYAGPDCGLGSWPSQEIAFHLLSNVAKGIMEFRKQ